MPGQGEQHKPAATSINPFEEVKPHVSEYTAQEIATLSSRLEKQLGPEYISARQGPGGGKVHYLAADKCINLANEVFGFNGWSSGIQNVQIDFVDENQTTGRVSLGLSVIVRDIGYGHCENAKGKAAAFEKAKKEGTTDGLKRALRNFGNLLGNCVYDKEYVAKVTKLKMAPTRWDPDNLHRHPDFAPIKRESAINELSHMQSLPQLKREWPTEMDEIQAPIFKGDPEDEFGSDDFDEADFSVPQGDHPDEIMLDPTVSSEHFRRRNSLPNKAHPSAARSTEHNNVQMLRSPLQRNHSVYFGPAQGPQTPVNGATSSFPRLASTTETPRNQVQNSRPLQQLTSLQQGSSSTSGQQLPPQRLPQSMQPPTKPRSEETPNLESSNPSDHDPPIGFFTARAAESLQNNAGLPLKAPAFNPHLESPSIRKTAGVDHTKTKPVGREVVGAPPPPALPAIASRGNFVNPQSDKTRKVGMPVGAASPLQNRGSYKPPQMKRPAESTGARSALGDVTVTSVNVPPEAGGDVKRQRIGVEGLKVENGEGMLGV
ncbi:DNA repair protein rad52 [Mycoblastus sanguinarius]|nr:DNA repair protein rad52 [Mycoblastus sanguinarius]